MTVKSLLNAFRDYVSLREEEIVQEWFDGFDWNLSERNLAASTLPVVQYMDRVSALAKKPEQRLIAAVNDCASSVKWAQTYTADDFGPEFINNYGHIELIGTRGHYVSDELACGFILFGPETLYPNHWHVAEEIYFPLTSGTLWSRDGGEFLPRQSGECIYHESNMHHAIQTSDQPILAAYVWQGGDLAQKSDF